jgi:TonB family protein
MSEVTKPILLTKVEPKYSEDARLAKYSGGVLLSIEIGPDGVPVNVVVIRGLDLGLDQKAVEAVTQWRFKPATLGGEPVAVAAQVEINFRLM